MAIANSSNPNKGMAAALKLYIQLTLTMIFFFVELIVGYLINSIALMADALHMLNDVCSLAIAIYCNHLKLNSNHTMSLTYGFQRAEVLGALINSVLLIGLCITILLEAIPRFFNLKSIENPGVLLIVGIIGLLFNVFGMFLFGHSHNHSHDHDHSHTTHDHNDLPHNNHEGQSLINNNNKNKYSTIPDTTTINVESSAHFQQRIIDEGQNLREINSNCSVNNKKHTNKENINMKGVYLHVLGDALANLAVITTSLVIMYMKSSTNKLKYMVDPLTSVIITLLTIKMAVPLIKSCSMILLQGVPTHVPLEDIRNKVLSNEGVYGVHELHVWQLADNKVVGSCHVTIDYNNTKYMELAEKIKAVFHEFGVHSVTVQPEYVEKDSNGAVVKMTNNNNSENQEIVVTDNRNTICILNCESECNEAQCCPPAQDHTS